MPVLARMIVAEMDTAAYDQISVYLSELVRKQPGFLMHIAYPSPGGFLVGEVWETRGQFETWFTEHVKPNLPTVQRELIELHNVVRPLGDARQRQGRGWGAAVRSGDRDNPAGWRRARSELRATPRRGRERGRWRPPAIQRPLCTSSCTWLWLVRARRTGSDGAA